MYPGVRAEGFRWGLYQAGGSYLVIDRPADLPDEATDSLGRLTRRYRDCLVRFLAAPETPRRAEACDLATGYAVGADIGFTSGRRRLQLPAFSHRSLAPFLGRWRGDNEYGSYLILESIEAGTSDIAFRLGYSPGPFRPTNPTQQGELRFKLRDDGEALVHDFPTFRATLKASGPDELECLFAAPGKEPNPAFKLKRNGRDEPGR